MSRARPIAAAWLAATALACAAPAMAQHEGHAMPAGPHAGEAPAGSGSDVGPAQGTPGQTSAGAPMDAHAAHGMNMPSEGAVSPDSAPAAPLDASAGAHGDHGVPPTPDDATGGDPHAAHQMPPIADDPHAHHAVPAGTGAPPAAPAGNDPHAGHHAMPAMPPAADPHAGHGAGAERADPHAGHAGAPRAAPTAESPPPPEAGSGPPRAADAIWGAEAMRASRAANRREMGAMRWGVLMAERLEYRAGNGSDLGLWDVQGHVGGDIDKLWLKSEGELEWGGRVHEAEVQALWSHAVAPFFDLQLGVRQDLAGPARTHAVIGVQGLAPYQFEIDAAAFLSDRGDLTARIEAELDQRITQHLILQPRAELGLSAQNIPELGIGAGLDKATLGLRLRYEFTREFAPYLGLEQSWRLGRGADHARAAGDDPSAMQLVMGVRFWF